MKVPALRPVEPLRSIGFARDPYEVLPPWNPNRKRHAVTFSVEEKPVPSTQPLVDVLAEDLKVSKKKARKAIRFGHVSVNGEVVVDPDFCVDCTVEIVFRP